MCPVKKIWLGRTPPKDGYLAGREAGGSKTLPTWPLFVRLDRRRWETLSPSACESRDSRPGRSLTGVGRRSGRPGQADAVALAEYVCIAQYPLQPQFYQPLDDARMRQSYDWHVTTTIPCLQNLGYTTPEPPSLEVYIETYRATGEQWIAQNVGDLPFETFDQCPPVPSAAELFPRDE